MFQSHGRTSAPLDPKWGAVEDVLSEEELLQIGLEDYDGRLWGKCRTCGHWVMGRDHFVSKGHLHPKGRHRLSEVTESPAPADCICFYPQDWAGEPVDGAVLLDSFHYMKKKHGKTSTKVEYMAEVLQAIWLATGKVFMAVCSSGAALVKPNGSGALYSELLEHVPTGVEAVIAVICGNDFLSGNYDVLRYDTAWDEAAARLCAGR